MVILLLILILLAISLGIFALFVAAATIVVKKIWLSNRQKYQRRTYQHNEPVAVNRQRSTYNTSTPSEPKHGDISPTGWIYNGTTKLWEPPKRTGTSSGIKLNRTGPTYEEWKAAKEKENPRD